MGTIHDHAIHVQDELKAMFREVLDVLGERSIIRELDAGLHDGDLEGYAMVYSLHVHDCDPVIYHAGQRVYPE